MTGLAALAGVPSAASSLLRRVRVAGWEDISRRAARRAGQALAARFDTQEIDFPLLQGDVADSRHLSPAVRPERRGAREMSIAWLCTPPAPGSGGHTTFFRMVQGLEERGHRCSILLYDRHHGDLRQHRARIRQHWPELTARIDAVPGHIDAFDAYVASSWDTAHVLARRTDNSSQRLYFIQDFEPYFYARGSRYALAEDTYRFGFTNMALGKMVADTLRREVGAPSHVIPFGSDQSTYALEPGLQRSGVVFFARPGVDRRGYELGRLALQEFHRMHPEQEIHLYGSRVRGWGIPVIQHGTLSPAQLNSLYNQTIAGLALSFTNITLVAAEMLSAGNLAVVNDAPGSRADLQNPATVWAPATPGSLAQALSCIVTDPDKTMRSIAAASYAGPSWRAAQDEVARIITSGATS